MLQTFRAGSREYEFVLPGNTGPAGQNTFTVIVGRNGTGKSRLLRAVVGDLIDGLVDRDLLVREERLNLTKGPAGELSFDRPPSRIICVSTSPFDKFPMLRRDHLAAGYSYLGLRGLPSANLGLAYMARILFMLIDAAQRGSHRGNF